MNHTNPRLDPFFSKPEIIPVPHHLQGCPPNYCRPVPRREHWEKPPAEEWERRRDEKSGDWIGVREPSGTADAVNHPSHYTSHPSGVECITVIEHMNFCCGNAIKYIWRADLKADAIEDLKKARWYIDREIQRREAATIPPP